MKRLLPTLIFFCLAYNSFAQEDSIKTRQDKMFYPDASVEKPVEIVSSTIDKKNAEPVVDVRSEPLKKPKASKKNISTKRN